MVFTPFELVATPLMFISFFIFIAGIAIALISCLIGSKHEGVATAGLIGGAALVFLGIGILIATPNRPEQESVWLEDQASELTDYYGFEITANNLRDLEYPYEANYELDYLGTTAIQTGEARGDFDNVTLVVDTGRVYLYTQVDSDYVELEPVSK